MYTYIYICIYECIYQPNSSVFQSLALKKGASPGGFPTLRSRLRTFPRCARGAEPKISGRTGEREALETYETWI